MARKLPFNNIMFKQLSNLLVSLVFIFGLYSCQDEFSEHYKRPDWLPLTIYKQLEQKGNFKSFLTCVDKANYKDILSKAGYYTVFVPTDSAFNVFLNSRGFSSVNEIDSTLAKDIITYNLVYNAFKKERLDDFQSEFDEMWVEDIAFKRLTAYSKWVYTDTLNGNEIMVADQNGVTAETGNAFNYYYDKNNKHISYFTDNFFAYSSLTDYDYNYFFPETQYTGFNVLDARVIEPDMMAENGVIHVIDKVLTPLPNLEDFIAGKPEYSMFKMLIDTFIKDYSLSEGLTASHERATGQPDDVYIKWYPGMLVPPNCENYLKYDDAAGRGDFDAQINNWTIFVPTNDAITDFFNSKFLVHYNYDITKANPDLVKEFINTHCFQTMVWPSKFGVTTSPYGETPRFDLNTNIVDHQYASNGAFYATNKVQESNIFFTLFGNIIFDPDYALMWEALKTNNMEGDIFQDKIKLTVFMVPNEVFKKIGLNHDGSTWTIPDTSELGTNGAQVVTRLIKLHIIENVEIEDMSQKGVYKTIGGEYIRFGSQQIWSSSNKKAVAKNSTKKYGTNGVSFVLSGQPITFSNGNVGVDIENNYIGFTKYVEYLKKTAEANNGIVYNTTTQAIANVKTSVENTILIPTDAAIDSAIAAGLLPKITGTLFTDDEINMVYRFVMYHIINGAIITANGEGTGQRSTLYSTVDGKTYLGLNNQVGAFTVTDSKGRVANWIDGAYSNILSNRAIIHQIDNYLDYRNTK